ncbi:MAG: peptidoglycan bridge formation glycyltransferase FemA/FemB family protein [Bacilli bacterium]|nr:peptidoglycan bridge formation glycyltransferase FemA/FemB family protein [Bacilli bacterium]
MKIVKLSAEQFNKYASQHRYRNYYQTSQYANVMVKFGYHAQFLGIATDDNKLIGATLLMYKEVFMGNKVAYAPHGILFDYEDLENTKEMVKILKKTLSKQGIMFIRIDPYIPLTIRDNEGNTMNFNNKGNQIIENLTKSGFKYKGKTLYFETEKPRWEALVLLQKDIREIFNKVDKRTRNKLRRASNSGVEVYKDNNKDITTFYRFVAKKEKKPINYFKTLCNSFEDSIDIYYAKINTETYLINSRRNYEKEVEFNETLAEKVQDMNLDIKDRETYLNKKMESDKLITVYKNNLLKATDLLKSNPDGIPIGTAMVIKYDNAAYLIAEGIDEEYGALNASTIIKWQLIEDYNNQGFKYVNLNGVVGDFENQNEYSGLNESKLGFNSIITEYVGEFDMVLNNLMYSWYQKTSNK